MDGAWAPHSDSMLSRRAEIGRLRRIAVAALRRYPVQAGTLSFVAHGENTTFRLRGADSSFLVRVHRPQRHGVGADQNAAIASEIAWLRAIRADTHLAVPEPMSTRDGAVTVEASDGDESRVCSVLRWMSGRIYENSPSPIHLQKLGAATAALHHHADAWTPPASFLRIRWNREAFFGDVMTYGGLSVSECRQLMPASLGQRYDAVAERMVDMDNAPDRGLMHADLHLGNAVFDAGDIKLIDFDDCGTGPRLYDLAVALWELRDRDDYPRYRDAFLSAYLSTRDADTTRLDDYIALRQVAFALWYTGMSQRNPAFAARLRIVHEWSEEMIDLTLR